VKDSDGDEVKAGDRIWFSYGIPQVVARGRVFDNGKGNLWAYLTGKHWPKASSLRSIKKHNVFYKEVKL